MVRRRCKGEYDKAAFKVLAEAVRHMIKQFQDLERPFLEDHALTDKVEDDGTRIRSRREYAKYGLDSDRFYRRDGSRRRERRSGAEKQHSGRDWSGEEMDEHYVTNYDATGLGHRLLWLRKKGKAQELSDKLSRVQMSRITRQTTDIAVATHYLARAMQDLDEKVSGMEARLNRVVGVGRAETGPDTR